jgi:uncharacterized protein
MSPGLRSILFISIVLSLTAAIHGYLWMRLVRDPGWSGRWTAAGTALLAGLGLSIAATLFLRRVLPREAIAPLATFAYLWLGMMFLTLMLLLASELLRLGARLWMVREGLDSPERRQFLSRAIAGVVMAGSGGLSVGGVCSALGPVAIKPVRVGLRGLPRELEGFRIALVTDLHIGGPRIYRDFVEMVVRRTNETEPDLIAITGDLVDGSVAQLAPHAEPLAELRARHGVFFVTGNHEYYSGVGPWVEHLRRLGMRVLENERVTLEHDGARLDVAGVHDWRGRAGRWAPDLARALEGRDPQRKLVLLAHQPAQIHEAARQGVDLQLSGHTHGGQIFPFRYFVRLAQPYVEGLHDHHGTMIYVSRGTGQWGPPMRIGAPSEITRLELSSAASAASVA